MQEFKIWFFSIRKLTDIDEFFPNCFGVLIHVVYRREFHDNVFEREWHAAVVLGSFLSDSFLIKQQFPAVFGSMNSIIVCSVTNTLVWAGADCTDRTISVDHKSFL